MLVPWGLAAGYAVRRFWPVFLIGAAACLLIELTQGLLGNGTCHSDDLVRNAAGAAIGAGLGVVLANVYGTRTGGELRVGPLRWTGALTSVQLAAAKPTLGHRRRAGTNLARPRSGYLCRASAAQISRRCSPPADRGRVSAGLPR